MFPFCTSKQRSQLQRSENRCRCAGTVTWQPVQMEHFLREEVKRVERTKKKNTKTTTKQVPFSQKQWACKRSTSGHMTRLNFCPPRTNGAFASFQVQTMEEVSCVGGDLLCFTHICITSFFKVLFENEWMRALIYAFLWPSKARARTHTIRLGRRSKKERRPCQHFVWSVGEINMIKYVHIETAS